MHREKAFTIVLFFMFLVGPSFCATIPDDKADAFAGQDLHLTAAELISHQLSSGEHALVFTGGFSMSIGANQFASDNAVVWIVTTKSQYRGLVRTDYKATIYLQDNVSFGNVRSAETTGLNQTALEGGQAMLVRFDISGEVFVTADKREVADPHSMELYRTALGYARSVDAGPKFVVQPGAVVPDLPPEKIPEHIVTEPGVPPAKPKEKGLIERIFKSEEEPVSKPEPEAPRFTYPVVFAPAGPEPLKFDLTAGPDGTNVITIRERFYVSQKQDEEGRLLELQADDAVVFYTGAAEQPETDTGGLDDLLARSSVSAIYLAGDVIMSEGQRVIRADEIFYDFQRKRAIAINAVMRNFDSQRGIPIYVRAAKLRQLSQYRFAAEDITLTTSEFYLPQISVNASSVVITDTTSVDEQLGRMSDSSYDAEMKDIAVKWYDKTFFRWPGMRSNLQRPDVPLQSAHLGYDNTWGMSVETKWYLSRVLGMRESPGTESSLLLDYFGKRGIGAGVEIVYDRPDHFGKLHAYVINDHGDDKLGRDSARDNVKPPRELRGRVGWEHRQFLPDNWQLSMGVDYVSDEYFTEQFYRDEFNLSRRETYVHLKRAQDNWAFAILGKGRINDFYDELEELPSAEFHWIGQSLFNDTVTLYSDSQVSHMRQRIGNEHMIAMNQETFTFISHRTELDFPLWLKPFKVVPYIAGWYGHDDRSGFTRTLVDGTNTGETGDNNAWIGEAGIRVATQLWKVYPNVRSRLWDLDQIRHIIEPHATAVIFEESDISVRQHDVLHVGVSQRLQTKRGPANNRRTVDWMRLDIDGTWVNHPDEVSDGMPGADRFIWNKPSIPLRVLSAPEIFNGDLIPGLPTFERYGPRRDYFGADFVWRVSDTTAVLSDMNYDIQSGVVQQANFGFSRLVWPNLSYYIGSRYLRRTSILGEKGSNAFTFAATYVLDPRYTLVFGQQYDLDYGASIRSDISIIRRYHRANFAITFSADESIDQQSIVLSIWPQGVPEMGLGHRRLAKLGPVGSY